MKKICTKRIQKYDKKYTKIKKNHLGEKNNLNHNFRKIKMQVFI